MLEWLRRLPEDLGRLWSDLFFATANGAVEAVRYEPRRMLLTGSRHLESIPGGRGAVVAGRVSHDIDDWLERLALRVGSALGSVAEGWVRWFTGAAGGVIDHVGASALDDLRFQGVLSAGMLKPHPRTVAVLFVDMRGFSRLTVALDDTQHLADRIGEYLSDMTRVIEAHHGVVFQYMGDGLLALFLPELTREKGHALLEHLAGAVSQELHAAFRALEARWRTEWEEAGRQAPKIGLALGITYGPATIGLIGPPGKKFFGVVGPQVNLAAFLCSQAEAGSTLIDEESFLRTGASLPKGARSIRLRSEKLHQRIATIRVLPSLAE
ncbi:MAG: adenylate/guanylate cyclase domain-containing protein [Deltaproteobacteria bacterium]|nr:adenylate/guanylate cyclase domain-containing protein [Deltaproteobacteria bacterium]